MYIYIYIYINIHTYKYTPCQRFEKPVGSGYPVPSPSSFTFQSTIYVLQNMLVL